MVCRSLRWSSLGFALLWAGCAADLDGDVNAGPGPGADGRGNDAGDAGGAGGAYGQAGGSGQPDWGQPVAPSGSFDVRFVQITPIQSGGGPRLERAPSDGKLLRIDFPTECGDAEGPGSGATPCVLRADWQGMVLVTLQGGAPVAYEATRQDRVLILEKTENRVHVDDTVSVAGAGGVTEYFVSDAWTRFVFPLNALGQVVPPVQATGVELISVGDGQQAAPAQLDARASFRPDATEPDARLVVGSSFSPPDAQFPWDPLVVTFDEPVVLAEPGKAIVATPVDAASPSALVWRWAAGEVPPPETLSDAFGITTYRGYWVGWDASPAASLVSLGLFRDPSNNLGAGFAEELKLVAPAAHPLAEQSFDADAGVTPPKVVLWGGAAAFAGGGCEGGCVRFDFERARCGMAQPPGLALRLTAPAGADLARLQLRARIRVEETAASGASADELAQLSLQAVWAGSEAIQRDDLRVDPGLWGDAAKALAPPLAPVPPAVPPAGPREVAVVLRAGSIFATEACRGAAPAPVTTGVIVDAIALEEANPL